MKNFLFPLTALILVCSNFTSNAYAESVKFGFNTSYSPPFVFQFENQGKNLLTGGIVHEIAMAIGDELHQGYTFVGLSSAGSDSELIKGVIDLDCYDSFSWEQGDFKEQQWSQPLFTQSNVLVGKKVIPFSRASDVNNITVGTIEKFNYPDLTEAFKKKSLKRIDSLSTTANLNRLFSNQLDYVIMSDIEYNYFKSVYPKLTRSSFAIDKASVQCSISKKSTLSMKKLNDAIAHLKSKNVFQTIYDRYTNPAVEIKPIIYGLNDTNSPPFLIFDSGESSTIKEGVFLDLGMAIGKQMKRPIRFMLSSRKRLDSGLSSGRIELVCYNNEKWVGEYAQDYLWSIPIFKHSNYVVGTSLNTKIHKMKAPASMIGETIGTSLGFIYPSMEKYFRSKLITRDDALSGTANVSRLNSGKIPYIILNNLEYTYYKKQFPDMERAPFEFDAIDVKCSVSKNSDLKISDINKAITDLKKSGDLQKIFK